MTVALRWSQQVLHQSSDSLNWVTHITASWFDYIFELRLQWEVHTHDVYLSKGPFGKLAAECVCEIGCPEENNCCYYCNGMYKYIDSQYTHVIELNNVSMYVSLRIYV